MMPSLTSGVPSLAFSDAMRTWQAMASSQPPPRAKPLTAAITGLPSRSMRSSTRCPRRERSLPSTGLCVASSAMSAPATNAFSPAPVRMTPRVAGSAARAAKAASSSSTVPSFRALSLSGRLMVTKAMPSRISTRRFWSLMVLYQARHRPRRLLRIIVEPAAGLAAVEPGLHHALEERGRGEALLTELVEHDVGDRVGGVQPHEVEQGQRAHGMPAAQAHPLVDVHDGAGPFLEGADRVEQIGHEQAVHHEARLVGGAHRRLAQAGREGRHLFLHRRIGAGRAHDLDQLHQGNGIEEVKAHEARRPLGGRRHLGDGEGRGVGGEDRSRPAGGVEGLEDLTLDVEALGDDLDDEVALPHAAEVRRALQSAQDLRLALGRDLALLHAFGQEAFDLAQALLQEALVDLAHEDLISRFRAHLRDAGPHESTPDDADTRHSQGGTHRARTPLRLRLPPHTLAPK